MTQNYKEAATPEQRLGTEPIYAWWETMIVQVPGLEPDDSYGI